MSVDPPSTSSTSGRLGMKLWNTLVEGGAVRGFGKQMGMRRRNKEGMVGYGDRDPLDKPDIRHLILRIILPLFPSPSFQPHAKTILPPLYSNLAADPPITVLRILTALWAAISSPSFGLNRRVSLILFQERSIEALWGQLGRDDVEEKSGKKVGELVRAFLEGITATPGKGVCFPDEGWYPRQMDDSKEGDNKVGNGGDTWRKGLHNRILGNVVRKVGNKVVDDEGIVGEWMIEVFRACPELVSGYEIALSHLTLIAHHEQILGTLCIVSRTSSQRSMDGDNVLRRSYHFPPRPSSSNFPTNRSCGYRSLPFPIPN